MSAEFIKCACGSMAGWDGTGWVCTKCGAFTPKKNTDLLSRLKEAIGEIEHGLWGFKDSSQTVFIKKQGVVDIIKQHIPEAFEE